MTIQEHNTEVQNRQYCQVCNVSVREGDYDCKFMQAGGALAGPFCSRDCHYAWLLE